jgi:hypothetical protein
MTDFGIFYPVGHLVAAFASQEDAEQVQKDLATGGYDADDVRLYTCAQVAVATERNLEDHSGFLARLGKSDQAVKIHLDAAKHGATFLLIYAPGDTDATRAMNVIRRVPFKFVHRYHRLAIEEMK